MRIGLLSFEYPPETGFGGIGTYTWYQARALARLGHEVHVLAGSKTAMPLTSRVSEDGVHVHRFRPEGLAMKAFDALGNRWQLWWTRQRLENSWAMYFGIKELHRKHPFDILEMPECGAEGFLVNPLLDIPTVVRFHSPSQLIMPFYDVRRGDIRCCSWIERRAIGSATALTSCSAFLASDVHKKLGVRVPVEIIPNGIDLHMFDHQAVDHTAREQHGIPTDKPMILFTGRIEKRKGIHLCADIVSAILSKHDVSFVFAGQDLFGHMANSLLPSIQSQGFKGSLHHLGRLELPEVRSLLRSCEIFLLPSIWENCPYSCIEAMAAGRAIVASDHGGLPELIQDGVNGLLAPSGDAAALAARIDLLLRDESLRTRLGSAARASATDRLTSDRIARLSEDVYKRVSTGQK